MSDLYIYSTLTGAQNYRTDSGKVLINGGANLPGARLPDGVFLTAAGVVTKVTAEQYQELEQNEVFKLHKKNGFIRVENAKHDPEKVAADMERRDNSAPDTEQDAEEGTKQGRARVKKDK